MTSSKMSASHKKSLAVYCNTFTPSNNRYSLERQFINKKKRFTLLTKEIHEKQRSGLEMYESLMVIKHKLKELDKQVQLKELKLVNIDIDKDILEDDTKSVKIECRENLRYSIQMMLEQLVEIFHNLLNDTTSISTMLETDETSELMDDNLLKQKGSEMKKQLDLVVEVQKKKFEDIVCKWKTLVSNKPEEEKMGGHHVIHQIGNNRHKKLLEATMKYGKTIKELEKKIKDLNDDIVLERKSSLEQKNRNCINNESIKIIKAKMRTLETNVKEEEEKNSNLTKKLQAIKSIHKSKEEQWLKEKEELKNIMKQQKETLEKITKERNQFEARCKEVEEKSKQTEKLIVEINELKSQVVGLNNKLEKEKEVRNQRELMNLNNSVEEGREDKVSSAYNLQPEDTEYLCAFENTEEGTEECYDVEYYIIMESWKQTNKEISRISKESNDLMNQFLQLTKLMEMEKQLIVKENGDFEGVTKKAILDLTEMQIQLILRDNTIEQLKKSQDKLLAEKINNEKEIKGLREKMYLRDRKLLELWNRKTYSKILKTEYNCSLKIVIPKSLERL
ncbi:coiled-coil domain-containing protein 39 isoform X2 [Aethina tumida]|nr:coiled-coil domain-containing protein 39 isoform X2 [Aethina tumida]